MVKFAQDILAKHPVFSNLYTKVHAGSSHHTSVITQAPLSGSAPPANMVFLDSEQCECFLPEEPEAADSDSSAGNHDTGYGF
jgi:hypothetical protein